MTVNKRMYLEAAINVHKETASLKETASRALEKAAVLPPGDKQIDLLYFSALFVSSGTNLNCAHFLPSELVKAESTVINKPLDIEHDQNSIIGHIYSSCFVDEFGNTLDLNQLRMLPEKELNQKTMHILISGIVYKERFPEVAYEIESGMWKVSMEALYPRYDIKIGNLILSPNEAASIGLDDSFVGREVRVTRLGEELEVVRMARVLRDIVFCGCGIVKDPANPPSVILDVANVANEINNNNNVTSKSIELSELKYDDTLGVCVNYKRFYPSPASTTSTPMQTDWCTLFDTSCTSFSRDAADVDCLKNIARAMVLRQLDSYASRQTDGNRTTKLLDRLTTLLTEE